MAHTLLVYKPQNYSSNCNPSKKVEQEKKFFFSVIEAYHIASVASENKMFADSILELTIDLEQKQKDIWILV